MTEIYYSVFPLTGGGIPRRYRLGLSQLREPEHVPSRSLPLLPSDTGCIVWGRSGIPCCSTRGTLAQTETPVCLGKSVCTACTPFWHDGERVRPACLGMNACIVCTIPALMIACLGRSACTPSLGWTNTACLGVSTCTACAPSLLGELPLPARD